MSSLYIIMSHVFKQSVPKFMALLTAEFCAYDHPYPLYCESAEILL